MFKFVVICVLLATAAAQRHGHGHGHGQDHGFSGNHGVSKSSDDVHAEILKSDSDVRPDGFEYQLETTNSISAKAIGDAYGNIQGDFQWISPEGEHVQVSYVADENGYQPNSAALPTPPPIPEAILKALHYIESHPPHQEDQHGHGHGRRF